MQQRLLSWLVLEVALADFCSTLRVSGRDVTDVLFQMSPILRALDDGDDPHEVPEQLSATVTTCVHVTVFLLTASSHVRTEP